jgi:tetratricopeptide (TPR) repeat protein
VTGQERPLALARHYVEIDRHQPALDALARAPEEALTDPEYWLLRAEALRGLERPREAAEAAARGLELDADDWTLLDLLALAHLDLDDFNEAERALNAAIELAPEHPTLHAHLALTLAHAKKFYAASAAIGRALALAPDDVGVLRIRAQISYLADDPEAQTYVDDLLARLPDDQIGHALRGMMQARRKDFVPAAHALREAARLDPSAKGIAEAAREAGVLAHRLLAPVRPIWRFGRWRAYLIFLALSIFLAGTGHSTIRAVLVVAWVTIAVLSWTAPPILRWRMKRKYGGR